MMRVGSLFSGIGGLDLGFERAGFEIAWQVEIEPYARAVLQKHWPNVPKYEDVKDVGAHNLGWVDVIVGGFPCQPVSVAGKRKGTEDVRWLWPEFARIIRQLRPTYAVMENVPGILHSGFGDVLRDLAESGYDAEWQVLSAETFRAPHLRERVFLVGYPSSIRGEQVRITGQEREAVGTRSVAARARSIFDRQIAQHLQEQGWLPEPSVGRLAYGIPRPVAQWRGLGNAVVPQVAQYVAECVKAHAERVA